MWISRNGQTTFRVIEACGAPVFIKQMNSYFVYFVAFVGRMENAEKYVRRKLHKSPPVNSFHRWS